MCWSLLPSGKDSVAILPFSRSTRRRGICCDDDTRVSYRMVPAVSVATIFHRIRDFFIYALLEFILFPALCIAWTALHEFGCRRHHADSNPQSGPPPLGRALGSTVIAALIGNGLTLLPAKPEQSEKNDLVPGLPVG